MHWAIALISQDDAGVECTVLKLLESHTWGKLLDLGLEVTPERWAEWQSRRGDLIVVPELPNLSLFAHIDEGPITFKSLASLRDECVTVLSRVTDGQVRELLEAIITGSTVAENKNGKIKIFPALSGEQEGDQFYLSF